MLQFKHRGAIGISVRKELRTAHGEGLALASQITVDQNTVVAVADAVVKDVAMQSPPFFRIPERIDIIVADHEPRLLEMLEIQIHVRLAQGKSAFLAAARRGVALAPVADAADVHVTHPRFAVVARGKHGQEPVELLQKDRIAIVGFPRSGGADGFALVIEAALRSRVHDPARRGELLLDAVRTRFAATDAKRDAQAVRGPFPNQVVNNRPIILALARFEVSPRQAEIEMVHARKVQQVGIGHNQVKGYPVDASTPYSLGPVGNGLPPTISLYGEGSTCTVCCNRR